MAKPNKMLRVMGALLLAVAALSGWYAWDGRQLERELAPWRDPRVSAEAIEQTLPVLSESRMEARRLAETAQQAAADGDWGGVDQSLLAMLSLADRQQTDGLLTSQLVVISIRALAIETLAEVYAAPRVPSAELVEAIAAIDQVAAIRDAVPAERAFIASRWDAGLAPRGLARQAFADSEEALTAIDMGEGAVRDFADRDVPASSGWTAALRSALRLQTRVELAHLALRLRTYRAEHGVYPEDLTALGERPTNPLSGEPIAYERVGHGFRLQADGMPEEELSLWAWEGAGDINGER